MNKKTSNATLLTSDKNYWKKTILKKNSSLGDVIKNLNTTGLKISLIIDYNNKLIGTVTDGDLRRGLLKGLNLGDKILSIINYKPIFVTTQSDKKAALTLMKNNYIEHVPILNLKGKISGLFFLSNLIASTKKIKKTKIVIMAGGYGKRLLPLTKKKPKPLIEVQGKPMLEQLVLNMKKYGFDDFIFSINYLGEMIEKYFGSGKKLNVNIEYIKEKKPLGTAGSLRDLKNLKKQDIIVTNCDVLSDIDYSSVLEYHKSNFADATMVVRHYEITNPFDVVKTRGKKFISFQTKPSKYENINAGIYVLNTKVLKYLGKNEKEDMPNFFKKMNKKKLNVIVYPIFENWADLGNINSIKNSIKKIN